MSENITKVSGTTGTFKPFKGGAVDIPYPVKGIVKNTIDSARTGRIQVYIQQFGSSDPNDSKGWVSVSYLSPFYGSTPGSGGDKTGYGSFKNNPHSYGWWSTPPDVGTEVICVFLSGKKDFGYYIGCIPQIGLNHMIPAIGASNNVVPSDSEAAAYGGASLLPVTEHNENNKKISDSPTFASDPKTVHSAMAGQMAQQGLITDPIRGPITSSAMRESPSRVFGISTPGRPIYASNLGSNDAEVAGNIASASKEKLKVVARRGGHTFVMDDGDIAGKNQMFRLRTAAGHQITMSDDGQTLFITHANGQSYVELGKEGTVDIFSTNSFNVRTQGDINFHADNDINLHAEKHLNVYAKQINMTSDKDTNISVGTTFAQQTGGDHTLKVDAAMSINAAGDASMASGGTAFINGSVINLNTGAAGLSPEAVDPIAKNTHADTLHESPSGWVPAPDKLKSIVTRAPAHMPWVSAGKGVKIEASSDAMDLLPEEPSMDIQDANDFAPSAPDLPTTPATIATVPPIKDVEVGGNFDPSTTSALVSQSAVTVSAMPGGADAIAAGAGVITDATGAKTAGIGTMLQSPAALEAAGTIKPGSGALVDKLVKAGKSVSDALPTNLFTGKGGVSSLTQYVSNIPSQISNQISGMKAGSEGLQAAGVISGKESPTQIGGLVAGAAAFGASAVSSFVKSASSGGNPLIGAASKALPGGLGSMISGGNFAAKMGDAAANPLSAASGGSMLDSLKGGAAKAFDSVKSTFAKLKGGVPQVLPGSTPAVPDVASAAPDALKSLTPSLPTTSEGGGLSASLAGVTGLASGLGDKLKSSMSGLTNNPKATLGSLTASLPGASSLKGMLGALPTGGAPQIKIPEIGAGTFNRDTLEAQAKSLLGDGVPQPPTSASTGLPAASLVSAASEAAKKGLSSASDAFYDIKKRYLTAKAEKGPDDPETIAAREEMRTNIAKQEELQAQANDSSQA